MKKYLLTTFAFVLMASFAHAQDLAKARSNYSTRLYSAALESYKPFLTSKNADLRYEAQLKTVLSLYNIVQYDNALKTIYSFPLPSASEWKARYYFLKYYLINQTSYAYGDNDLVESQTDPTEFTQAQKEKDSDDALLQLWNMRKDLISFSAEKNKDYYQISYNTSFGVLTPTVFDYMMNIWQGTNVGGGHEKLLEEAYTLGGEDRSAVREIWHIERILLLDKNAYNHTKEDLPLAVCLDSVSGHLESCTESKEIKPLLFKAAEVIGKAKAAFESARIYLDIKEYEKSAAALDYCLRLPLNYFSSACKSVKDDLQRPVVTLSPDRNPFDVPTGEEVNLSVNSANINRFYVKIFPLSEDDFKQNNTPVLRRAKGKKPVASTDTLTWTKNPATQAMFKKLAVAKPSRTLSVNVKYPQKYAPLTSRVTVPYISDGFYAVAVGQDKNFSEEDSILYLNYTDLAAIATTPLMPIAAKRGAQPELQKGFNVYTLDAKTGNLRPNINLFTNAGQFKTDSAAQAFIPKNQNRMLSLLAKDYGNNAIIPYVYIYDAAPSEPYNIITNTDREIYRPGQEVKLAFTVLAESKDDITPLQGKNTLSLKVSSNGRTLQNIMLPLDDMGSAEYAFKLPKDIMLGSVEFETSCLGSFSSYSVRVEEYKRPEFEVVLDKNTATVTYDKPLTVIGNAKYYYGSPVPNAKVTYSISQEYYIPWFCWYFPQRQNRQNDIEGKTVTGKDGSFKIVFTPKEDADNKASRFSLPQRYTVRANVVDAGGRTISDSQTFTVSRQEKFFSVKSEKGFFRQDKEDSLAVQMVNADEQPLEGKAVATIYTATPPADKNYIYEDTTKLSDFEAVKKVKSFDASFNKQGPTSVTLPALKEGFYIIKFNAKASDGKDNEGEYSFIVVNPANCKLDLPSVTIPEYKTYYSGQKAYVLIGAGKAKGNKYLEIYKKNVLTSKIITISKPGAAVVEVTPLQGGITLNWFAAYGMKYFHGNTSLSVPYNNKDLTLKINGKENNLPAEKAAWTLEVKDGKGAPVDARAIVTAYDKSLDYYAEHSLDFSKPYISQDSSSFGLSSSLDEAVPYSRAAENFAVYDSSPRFATIRAKGTNEMAMAAGSAMPQMAMDAAAPAAYPNGGAQDKEAAPVKIRENFAETAFWSPMLKVVNGVAPIKFTMPERLTGWTMLAAAFTKDLKTGKTSFNFTTKQDFMVRLETPRFLREGDKFELRAILTNNSAQTLPATLELVTNLDGKDASTLLGITQDTAQVSIAAGEQKVVSWPISAPKGTGIFEFTVAARAADLSDGEVKSFPLLPSAQRLSESKTIAVKDGQNSIALNTLAQDTTAQLSAVRLSVEPSLIMPVLNAMPLLTYNSESTVTGLLNSYLPLAIVNTLYNKYPDFKAAAADLPKRKTSLPAFDSENDAMLLTELSKSPWYSISKGYPSTEDTIDMFDAKVVAAQKAKVLDKLADYQNQDGGFSWIKGGQSSVYITMHVLDIMAQARDFGVEIPEAMVRKALKYLTNTVSIDIVKPSYYNLTSALYMSYLLSCYPQDWHNYDVKKLINTADEFGAYMTPLGKAYAAIVCQRLGYTDRADLYIQRLFDSAKSSPVTGTYWAPEERSWLWYNDTITQHTMIIRALNIINPQDPRIKDLVKWLMLNRKTSQWDSTDETAKAVYTLLDVMNKSGALTQTKEFTIDWGGRESVFTVKPYDTANLTLSKYDELATPITLKAKINKEVIGSENKNSLDDFASLTALYTSFATPSASPEGLMNVNKQMYLVKDKQATPLADGAQISVGDEIQVRLTINCKNAFDFVNIIDPKPAAFESDNLLSAWRYDKLSRYEEVRDSATNFFMDWLPNGTYELKYTIRPTTAGTYRVGAAVMQSMFAPQFTAHSQGFTISVK